MYLLMYDLEITTKLAGLAILRKYTYDKSENYIESSDFDILFENSTEEEGLMQTILEEGSYLGKNDVVVGEDQGKMIISDLFESVEVYSS